MTEYGINHNALWYLPADNEHVCTVSHLQWSRKPNEVVIFTNKHHIDQCHEYGNVPYSNVPY